MLALALGLLGAVVVVGAFCGGVFLGCWLCGEDGTPARAERGPSRPAADRKRGKRRRRTFRDGYDAGYDAGFAAGYETGFAAGRGADRRETLEKAGNVRAGGPVSVQTPDAAREAVPDRAREAVLDQARAAVPDQARENIPDRARDAAPDEEREDVEEQAREAARRRRQLLDEQAAFRALQHYSAEHAYGLGGSGFPSGQRAGRYTLD